MLKNRRVNLILGIILALTCVFSSTFAFVVSADETGGLDLAKIEATYSRYGGLVAESGIIAGEDSSQTESATYKTLYDGARLALDIDAEEAARRYSLLEGVGVLAGYRLEVTNSVKSEFDGTVERESLTKVDNVPETGNSEDGAIPRANKFLKDFQLSADDLEVTAFTGKYTEMEAAYNDFCKQIDDIRDYDAGKFYDLRNAKAEEIGKEYESLTEKTNVSANPDGSKVYGSYSEAQLKKLNEVLESEVYSENDADGNKAYYPQISGRLFAVGYDAAKIKEKRAELDDITADKINELRRVEKNDLEKAYNDYNDYLNCRKDLDALKADENATSDDIKEKEAELTELATKAKESAENGLSFYDKAAEEVKKAYSEKAKSLRSFVEDPPEVVLPEYVAALTDEYSAVKVTAYYIKGEKPADEAKAFPSIEDGGTLRVYANANGSAKKDADQLMKAKNKFFSVAYFINIRIYRGARPYDVEKDAKNLSGDVCYRVEIDLSRYYEKYCEVRGYEKNKQTNVENAFETIKGKEGALCFTYERGVIEEAYVSDQTTLEGGKLVFYTRSLNDFCVAGTGLENYLANPWVWLIAIAVIILLIIIIKIIVKNCRYSIRFVSNGGTPVRSIGVAKNEAIVLPASPTKTGMVFAGWYTDEACTVRFIETVLRRRKGYKLYAKWAAPVSAETLTAYYDGLRLLMTSYEKCSFKPVMGLCEKELIADMFGEENYLALYLAITPADAKDLLSSPEDFSHKDKKFAALSTKIIVSDERTYRDAVKLVEYTMTSKGLQLKEKIPEKITSTPAERKEGFAYFVNNERVASNPAEYFELIRIAVKSFVLETDNGTFKPGDRFTFARAYCTNKQVDLYMPVVKSIKELSKGDRSPRFSDTPVHIIICDKGDLIKALEIIEKLMLAYGFTKYPENSNDLEDVILKDTDGFAYTIKF